jgi:hypothetical protein
VAWAKPYDPFSAQPATPSIRGFGEPVEVFIVEASSDPKRSHDVEIQLRSHDDDLRACDTHLQRGTLERAWVKLKFAVARNGALRGLVVSGNDQASAALQRCVHGKATRFRLSSAAGLTLEVKYVFDLPAAPRRHR